MQSERFFTLFIAIAYVFYDIPLIRDLPQKAMTTTSCQGSFWPHSGRFFALIIVIAFVFHDISLVSVIPQKEILTTSCQGSF